MRGAHLEQDSRPLGTEPRQPVLERELGKPHLGLRQRVDDRLPIRHEVLRGLPFGVVAFGDHRTQAVQVRRGVFAVVVELLSSQRVHEAPGLLRGHHGRVGKRAAPPDVIVVVVAVHEEGGLSTGQLPRCGREIAPRPRREERVEDHRGVAEIDDARISGGVAPVPMEGSPHAATEIFQVEVRRHHRDMDPLNTLEARTRSQ